MEQKISTRALLLNIRQVAGHMGRFEDNVLATEDCVKLAELMTNLLEPGRRKEAAYFLRLAYKHCYPRATDRGSVVSDEHIVAAVLGWHEIVKETGKMPAQEQKRTATIAIAQHFTSAYDETFRAKSPTTVLSVSNSRTTKSGTTVRLVINNPSPVRG